jgi:hypothetical protein
MRKAIEYASKRFDELRDKIEAHGVPPEELLDLALAPAMRRRPTVEEIDRRTTAAVDLYCELYGGFKDEENSADELDAWALTPEGRRQLERRGIKPWWPWSTMP